MAWSTNDIMNFFKFHLRKNQAGSISATDLFYAWNTEQSMYHNDLVGRWQGRSNGKSGANTGMIMNETIRTELAPFTINDSIAISSGNVTKPSDFIYTIDVRIGGISVTPITPDQISSVNASVIDAPSASTQTYYYTEYEGYYYLLPQSVTGNATVDYVASCRDIVWGYTFDADGRQVYSVGASIQPQWLQNTIVTICKRTLTSFGISFKDKDFEEFGRIAQASGD
jgi:hypothetical protein